MHLLYESYGMTFYYDFLTMILGVITTALSFIWQRTQMNLLANACNANLCFLLCEAFVRFHADIYSPVSLKLDLIFRFKWTCK